MGCLPMRVRSDVVLDPIEPRSEHLRLDMAGLNQLRRQRLEKTDQRRVRFVVAMIPRFKDRSD